MGVFRGTGKIANKWLGGATKGGVKIVSKAVSMILSSKLLKNLHR